jgi:hypothetical protein
VVRAHREVLREEERLREKWYRPVSAQREPVKPARTRAKSKKSRPLRGASRPEK